MTTVPRIPRPEGFCDRGVNIEQFILDLCRLKTFRRLGVRMTTGRKILTKGRGRWGTYRTPSLRRNWKRSWSCSGSGYYGDVDNPGRLNITVGGNAHPGDVMEVLLHEFIHNIGYRHGDEMSELIATAAKELWGVDMYEVTGKNKGWKLYEMDWRLRAWLKANWAEVTEKCGYGEVPPAAAARESNSKKSRIQVSDDYTEISFLVTNKAWEAILAQCKLAISWDESPMYAVKILDGECVEDRPYKNKYITLDTVPDWNTLLYDLWSSWRYDESQMVKKFVDFARPKTRITARRIVAVA